ncbi:MAG: L,D-transpeptidase family protein [Gordonia sp. (in: high G+C Gram-positive bacteria)]|uniref:L,D-transpeptidase family protein n=1 Tax=Gordonia sp. (in: high G+C Gram-positive bacteria) TaxID=84139 RepID=UPI0039E5E9D4
MWQVGLVLLAAVVALTVGVGSAGANPTAPAPAPTTPGTGTLDVQGMLDKLLQNFSVPGAPNLGNPVADTKQMVVVSVPTKESTTGTLSAFDKDANGNWQAVPGLVGLPAFVGDKGIGEPADNVHRTPEGTFGFDQAFGRLDNPGTKMPYKKVDNQDWWVSNQNSPNYNKMVHQPNDPGGGSENLYNSGTAYDYAVNIAHNPQNIRGKATAIFLHVSTGEPTWGCVSIPEPQMKQILQWMDPAKNPKVTIGVNVNSPADAKDVPQTTNPDGSPMSADQLSGMLQQFTDLIPQLLDGGAGSASPSPAR